MKQLTMPVLRSLVESLMAAARNDGGKPVFVAAADSSGVIRVIDSMMGAPPVSALAVQKKVWTAYDFKCHSVELEGSNPADFDQQRHCFRGGGIALKIEGTLMAYIGVSGRKPRQGEVGFDQPEFAGRQDHELALLAQAELELQLKD